MKKLVKSFMVMAVVVVMLAFTGATALASNYDAQADALKEMGLFLGTDSGYELEKIPTRAEAAVMLVRLLGKEAEVKAGTYEMPFTDVPDWAGKYVGYMYANSLTKGISATAFGSGDTCNEQMFTTFVLRALGYSDSSGDFTYSQAQDYAISLGLIEEDGTSDAFKRDDMVALSYSALFQPVKNSGGMTLLEKLTADRAVEATAADKYMDSYKVYQSLLAACAKTNSATSIQMSNDMDLQLKMDGLSQSITQKMDIAVVQSGSDYKMRIDSTTMLLGQTQKLIMYYADGWMYMAMGDTKYKYEYSINPDELAEMTEQSGMGEVNNPFYLIQSITKTDTATGVSYKVVYSPTAMNDMLDSILSQVTKDMEGADVQINALEMVYACDNNGNLQSMTMTGDIGMAITDGQVTTNIGIAYQSTTKIIATGASVTVALPADITAYETIKNPAA